MKTHDEYVKERVEREPDLQPLLDETDRQVRLGLAVYQLREKVGISQTELAARVEMSQPAIARLEKGDHMPSLATLWRIAAALNSVIEMTPDHQVRFRIRRATPIRKKRLRRSA